MLKRATAYAPPSAIARAAVSLLLLLGFYLTLLGIAALLFALPVVAVRALGRVNFQMIILFAGCWIPAGLLLFSVFTTTRPEFVPPRRRLAKAEAPALFALVEELAARAGTAPPAEIYLDCLPNLAVTEVGGVRRSRRIMIVGAPLLCFLSVDELRAGIAHELGHFIGGDTRLTAFTLQTHALFASVITAVERDEFRVGTHHHLIEGGLEFARAIGYLLVGGYSRFFLLVTRPLSRRQELAADALAASLVSAAAIRSTLEKVAICAPLYDMYLQNEVGFAMKQGAMPTDLTPGFHRLRDRLLESDKGQRFVERVRAQVTDKYDTHPALLDRLRALQAQPEGAAPGDERLASVLVADANAFDAWLLEATREQMIRAFLASNISVRSLQDLPWSQIPNACYAPAAWEAARRTAERLHPLLPNATSLGSMFAAVWRGFEQGKALELILRLEPALQHLPPDEARGRAAQLSLELLGILLQGALLEQGAAAEDSFGEPTLTLRFGDERINTAEALERLASDPAGNASFTRWAERFEQAGART